MLDLPLQRLIFLEFDQLSELLRLLDRLRRLCKVSLVWEELRIQLLLAHSVIELGKGVHQLAQFLILRLLKLSDLIQLLIF